MKELRFVWVLEELKSLPVWKSSGFWLRNLPGYFIPKVFGDALLFPVPAEFTKARMWPNPMNCIELWHPEPQTGRRDPLRPPLQTLLQSRCRVPKSVCRRALNISILLWASAQKFIPPTGILFVLAVSWNLPYSHLWPCTPSPAPPGQAQNSQLSLTSCYIHTKFKVIGINDWLKSISDENTQKVFRFFQYIVVQAVFWMCNLASISIWHFSIQVFLAVLFFFILCISKNINSYKRLLSLQFCKYIKVGKFIFIFVCCLASAMQLLYTMPSQLRKNFPWILWEQNDPCREQTGKGAFLTEQKHLTQVCSIRIIQLI